MYDTETSFILCVCRLSCCCLRFSSLVQFSSFLHPPPSFDICILLLAVLLHCRSPISQVVLELAHSNLNFRFILLFGPSPSWFLLLAHCPCQFNCLNCLAGNHSFSTHSGLGLPKICGLSSWPTHLPLSGPVLPQYRSAHLFRDLSSTQP